MDSHPVATTVQRHGLVHLTPQAWQGLVVGARQAASHAAFAHWAEHDLPLVVTRQHGCAAGQVRLGLPAPPAWGGQRWVLQVDATDLARQAVFPTLSEVAASDPQGRARMSWAALEQALCAGGVLPRVYGSHGWQVLTGIVYLHAHSDLDLLLPVDGAARGDAVVRVLTRCQAGLPRCDGELVFPDGTAVAWREWLAWRSGRARQVLRKRLDRVDLASDDAWLPQPAATGLAA